LLYWTLFFTEGGPLLNIANSLVYLSPDATLTIAHRVAELLRLQPNQRFAIDLIGLCPNRAALSRRTLMAVVGAIVSLALVVIWFKIERRFSIARRER
jgi:hypothetical protein